MNDRLLPPRVRSRTLEEKLEPIDEQDRPFVRALAEGEYVPGIVLFAARQETQAHNDAMQEKGGDEEWLAKVWEDPEAPLEELSQASLELGMNSLALKGIKIPEDDEEYQKVVLLTRERYAPDHLAKVRTALAKEGIKGL